MSELLQFIKQFSFAKFQSGFKEKIRQIQSTNNSMSLRNSSRSINRLLAPSLVIAMFATFTYLGMKVLQNPSFIMDKEIHQTLSISDDQKFDQSKSLFGDIQLATQNVLLRGIVITSDSSKALLDGFAIFEINGKSSNAISIGETVGNGITLKSIRQDSVIVSYLGQEIEYPLTISKINLNKIPANLN